jgi:DNA-binding CsgD family transcriptional regulator
MSATARDSNLVSHRAYLAAWDNALNAGLSPGQLGPDVAGEAECVRRGRGWVSWDSYMELYDRIRLVAGSSENFERVFEKYPDQWPFIGTATGLLVSPRLLYGFVLGTVTPTLHPHLRRSFVEGGDDRLALSVQVAPHDRGATAMFEATTVVLRSLPRLLNLPPANVEAQVSSHAAEYHVQLPRARTVAARVTPPVQALLDELKVFAMDLLQVTQDVLPPSPDIEVVLRRQGLTTRQCDVARGVVKGSSNKEIASLLGCAERTVELHLTMMMRKTRTTNRTELAALLLSS